ncbi:hypothetical protein HDU89_008672 [Geranomyces variabilis]|nr:hypothetical protein HDU89_008672 [Geranomyces variabilis]
MSALSVLYINMITSTPVAIFMVNEKASRTVMSKPPRGHPENQYAEEIVADSSGGVLTRAPAASASSVSSSTSMFTTRFLLDALFYGTVAGSLSLGAFVISMAFTGRGLNGYDASRCNDHSSTFDEAECSEIYEARGIAFTVLNATLLVHGWNCRFELESAFFGPEAHPRHNWPLFVSICCCLALTLITVFTPYISTTLFAHKSFTWWEWLVVVTALVIFVVSCEVWKACRRRYVAKAGVTVCGGGLRSAGTEEEMVDLEEGAERPLH